MVESKDFDGILKYCLWYSGPGGTVSYSRGCELSGDQELVAPTLLPQPGLLPAAESRREACATASGCVEAL